LISSRPIIQTYDKPVRVLLLDMIADLASMPGLQFSKSDAVKWFAQHYPRIKQGTVEQHLVRFSTNAPSRLHHPVRPDEDLLFQIDGSLFRRYDPSSDPPPIHAKSTVRQESRSAARLPAEILARATPEYVWNAVQRFLEGGVEHAFGPSTDFDLIADGGRRFPPKAVFGVALSLALGGQTIGPRHFSGGEDSTCFRLLRAADYKVVPKGFEDTEGPESDLGQEWSEGGAKLASHIKRERAKGLSQAKRDHFRRVHGKLVCERCGLDPVAHYESEQAEACIEIHHFKTQVGRMVEGHKTRLEDLQCLCANCHRLIHRIMRDENRQ
jgi:hypothetical protein